MIGGVRLRPNLGLYPVDPIGAGKPVSATVPVTTVPTEGSC